VGRSAGQQLELLVEEEEVDETQEELVEEVSSD